MESGQDLASVGDHLGGKLAVRVLQLLEGRILAKIHTRTRSARISATGAVMSIQNHLVIFLRVLSFILYIFLDFVESSKPEDNPDKITH